MALIKGKQILSLDATKVVESASKKFTSDVKIAEWDGKADKTAATELQDGLMPKEAVTKLGTIAEGANNYVHPANHDASMIVEDATHRFVTDIEKGVYTDKYTKTEVDNMISQLEAGIEWKDSVATFADIATTYPTPSVGWVVTVDDTGAPYRYNGTAWVDFPIATYVKATQTTDGLMSKEDKAKLDGITEGANNYVHPATHSSDMIDDSASSTKKLVTPEQITNWDGKASTAVATQSSAGLMSAEDKVKLDAGAGHLETLVVAVPSNGAVSLNTGIMTNGSGGNFTKSLKIALSVNGMVQAEGAAKDFTVSESAGNELVITWTNRHFQLETDDEVVVFYTQAV